MGLIPRQPTVNELGWGAIALRGNKRVVANGVFKSQPFQCEQKNYILYLE